MSFSYQLGANPPIDYPRFLVADTVSLNHIFEDQEIVMATAIETGQWQSSMFYSNPAGNNLPSSPVSYRRVAANLLDSLASNASRLSQVIQLLDVRLAPGIAADKLRAQAQAFRDTEDNSGAFVIIEQVQDDPSFRERFWKQVQRNSGVFV